MGIESSIDGMVGVEDVWKATDDGEVDWVGPAWGVIVFSELFEEISVWGMEFACANVAPGIGLTQVGNPLANAREGFSHCVSCHRFVFATVPSVSQGIDEHVAVAQFLVAQAMSEGAGDALLEAKGDPVAEGGGLGVPVLGGVGLAGELESRFEISLETSLGGGWTSCQGLCCGHWETK